MVKNTWEFKSEFDDTEKVYIGIVDGEVNKDNPKITLLKYLIHEREDILKSFLNLFHFEFVDFASLF